MRRNTLNTSPHSQKIISKTYRLARKSVNQITCHRALRSRIPSPCYSINHIHPRKPQLLRMKSHVACESHGTLDASHTEDHRTPCASLRKSPIADRSSIPSLSPENQHHGMLRASVVCRPQHFPSQTVNSRLSCRPQAKPRHARPRDYRHATAV